MVIVTAEEKAEPPPYTPVDPSSRSRLPNPQAAAGSWRSRSRSGAAAVAAQARNHLRVVRINDDIGGHWTINPSLTSPGATPSTNVYFETQRGTIDVTVAWVTPDSNSAPLPRARIDCISVNGDISLTNTTRPKGLPLYIKAAAHRKGDVMICAPSEFRGVMALRIPATACDWKTRIGLAPKINEEVICTRETALRPSKKGKDRQDVFSESLPSHEQILVELLVGADLEISDFNRTSESGVEALDLLEVEVGDGKILILGAEDAALGYQAEVIKPQDMPKTTRSWKMPGLGEGGVTFAVRDNTHPEGKPESPGVTIIIDEPKWLDTVRKKWGRLGNGKLEKTKSKSREKEKDKDKDKHHIQPWILSPQSSTTTLVSPAADMPRRSLGSPGRSPAHSPRLAPESPHARRRSDDRSPQLPLRYDRDLPPPPGRTVRSSSTSYPPEGFSPPPEDFRLRAPPPPQHRDRKSAELPPQARPSRPYARHCHSYSEESLRPIPMVSPQRSTIPIPNSPNWNKNQLYHNNHPYNWNQPPPTRRPHLAPPGLRGGRITPPQPLSPSRPGKLMKSRAHTTSTPDLRERLRREGRTGSTGSPPTPRRT